MSRCRGARLKGQNAGLPVLDGWVAAEESAGRDRELKKFIHELRKSMLPRKAYRKRLRKRFEGYEACLRKPCRAEVLVKLIVAVLVPPLEGAGGGLRRRQAARERRLLRELRPFKNFVRRLNGFALHSKPKLSAGAHGISPGFAFPCASLSPLWAVAGRTRCALACPSRLGTSMRHLR